MHSALSAQWCTSCQAVKMRRQCGQLQPKSQPSHLPLRSPRLFQILQCHLLWRMLAINFQQGIFVVDSQSWTISCYSCQAGPVAVKGKTEPEKPQTKCLLKHWTHPGFHYGIGCLPFPESMKSRSACVYLISSAGRLVSTSACQFARSSKMAEASKGAQPSFFCYICNVRCVIMHN